MIVTVLGGGNGAHAAVADLTLRGHEVRWWRRSAEFPNSGRMLYRDTGETVEITPALVTHDLARAVHGSDLVLAPVPAPAQLDLLTRLSGELDGGQAVAFTPGTMGSRLGAQLRPDVAFLETGTLPYLARVIAPGKVSAPVHACRLPVGSYPSAGPLADAGHAAFATAYPAAVRVSSGLDAALCNWGPIIHPPLIVHNMGALLSGEGDFDVHAEGTSAATLAVTDALDAERIALRLGLGIAGPHWPLEDYYAGRDNSYYPPDARDRLVGSGLWLEPVDLQHRYVTEDVRCGLVLNVALAHRVGVSAPVGTAIVTLLGIALGEDLLATGRTPESIGNPESWLAVAESA